MLSRTEDDVIVGNPPYVNMQTMSEEQKYFRKFTPEIYTGQNDLLYYFILRGIELLREGGTLGYITSRYFLESSYAKKFRQFILNNTCIKIIIDFRNVQLFEGVNVLSDIIILEKSTSVGARTNNHIKIVKVNDWHENHKNLLSHINKHVQKKKYRDQFIEVFDFEQKELTSESWTLPSQDIKYLREKMIQNFWRLADLCQIGKGMETGLNDAFIVDKTTIARYNLEKDLLKKYIKTRDIKRYSLNYRDLYLLYVTNDTDSTKYHNIEEYLRGFQKELESRFDFKRGNCLWYAMSNLRNRELFDNVSEKLVVPTYSTNNKFAYDACTPEQKYYSMTDTYIIVPNKNCPINLKYILALLNSRAVEFYHKNTAKLKREGYYEYVTGPLSKIPIPKINFSDSKEKAKHDKLVELADKMIQLNKELKTINTNFFDYVNLHPKLKDTNLGYYFNQLNMSDKKVLNNANGIKGKIKKVKAREEVGWLIVSVNYEDENKELVEDFDVLKCRFENLNFTKFIKHCILNHGKKIGKGNILDRVLKIENIPIFDNKSDAKNQQIIDEIMDSFLPASERKEKIEKEMKDTDRTIDQMVYKLYGLTDEDIKIVEAST